MSRTSQLSRSDLVRWPFATYCPATHPRSQTGIAETDWPTAIAEDDAHDPIRTVDTYAFTEASSLIVYVHRSRRQYAR
jgi:hypothetical protein